MKQILMDLDCYEIEVEDARTSGFYDGLAFVGGWLDSKKKLCDYLGENPVKAAEWGRIAIALGRQDELSKPIKL